MRKQNGLVLHAIHHLFCIRLCRALRHSRSTESLLGICEDAFSGCMFLLMMMMNWRMSV